MLRYAAAINSSGRRRCRSRRTKAPSTIWAGPAQYLLQFLSEKWTIHYAKKKGDNVKLDRLNDEKKMTK